MIAIITGDIINSKKIFPDKWIISLKQILNRFAKENETWEIFRGDSFQVEVAPKDALILAIRIKLAIKQHKHLDVRMAIGLGEKNYRSKKITQSNGSAFVNSGECFEKLKKTTLAVKSSNYDFDFTMNTMIQLALLTMDNWTNNSVKLITSVFDYPNLKQKELAQLLGKSQSTISEGLKRGGYDEIVSLLTYYKYKVDNTKW